MSDEALGVVAIVPAKDRADTVGATVEALRTIAGVDGVWVVDDGSVDGTAAAARDAGATVVRLSRNRGKGGAVEEALALVPRAHVYLLIDADLGATASEAVKLLAPVVSGQADMAIGVLPAAGSRGGLGVVRRLAAWGIRRATPPPGLPARAPLSGQRAVAGALLHDLRLAPRFGLEVAMTIDAVNKGARVVEVAVEMDHRHTGRRLTGFSHRARQGVDIARALWPRITSRRQRLTVIAVAALVALAATAWTGSQWEPSSVGSSAVAERVLIIGVPGLTWTDVGTGSMPALDRLLPRAAVGAMTVRTRSRDPSVVEGYATLGASARVQAVPEAAVAVTTPAGIHIPAAEQVRRRSGRHLPSEPGALGDALHASGRRTAVVGSADTAPNLRGAGRVAGQRRPAVVALMDRRGRVDGGSVEGHDLLRPEQEAPFGRRSDVPRVAAAAFEALATHDVVLVDPGDMDRARDVVELGADPSLAAEVRVQALTAADELIDRLTTPLRDSGPTLLMVISVVPPADEWRLTPVVAVGAGVQPGYLQSPSTKRLGLVALTDVAPTVLEALDVAVPRGMIGNAFRYHLRPPDLSRLSRLDSDAAFRERIYYPAALGFTVVQAVFYLLVALLLIRRPSLVRTAAKPVRYAALAIIAFPLATFLLRALPGLPTGGGEWVLALVGLDVAIVLLAVRFRAHDLGAVSVILGTTVCLLVADVATGARLQTSSILGYSPHTAARFYGMGNSAFAILAGATILGCALHLDHAPRRQEALASVAAVFALVVMVTGAPSLGDDVGGLLTLVPVFGCFLLLAAGRRVTWRALAAVAGVTAALLILATLVDLARAPDARTHLGRLASDTLDGGSSRLFTTIARKAEVNLRIIRASIWAWTVPITSAFLIVVLSGRRWGRHLLPLGSARRLGVIVALGAGVLGAVVNDSGVIVTALVLVSIGPLVSMLATATVVGAGEAPEVLEPLAAGQAGRRS